jgi:hypothetical protein
MKKVRLITIQRTVEETVTDKNGSSKVMKVKHWFPVKINAAIPLNHRMCK